MHEYTPQEKAAIITEYLTLGQRLTTREIADMVGLTRQGAWSMMMRLSRVLGYNRDDEGKWFRIEVNHEDVILCNH